jgi:anti-sigma B factor antagonist
MSVKVSVRRVNNVSLVDVAGRVTLGDGSNELREALRAMASEGQKEVVLNLAGLTYLDSSGIGVLVSSFATFRNQGGQLKLLNLNGRVKDLLLITKLYTVFEVFEDESSAVDSFSGISQSPIAHA